MEKIKNKMDIRIENGKLKFNDQDISLLSGTFHYWRVHPESWNQVLLSIKEMGLKVVETYIPWEFHEISQDEFDFEGRTDSRRDLASFLKMTKDMGLWLIIRPGPYIYSEWVNMGVPDDVLPYHRMHPYFKNRAAAYIQSVSEVIAPYQITQGGNIILLEPENEVDTFEQLYEAQLGLGEEPGPFQAFLKERYNGSIEELNKKWGSHLASFDNAHAVTDDMELDSEYTARYLDFVAFRADYITKCVDYYAREFKKCGIDIPMYANAYDIVNVQDFKDLESVVSLVGLDSYPAKEFTGKFSPKGEDYSHRRLGEVFRYLRTFSNCAYLAEYQAGTAYGMHYWVGVLEPNHYVMTSLAAIQGGIQGWNWFMIVNHDNWMMCPINEFGRKQGELFSAFSEMIGLFNHMDVSGLERVTNTSAFFNLKHQCTRAILDDPVLSTMYKAGIDYSFYNPTTGKTTKPVLFYPGMRWLPAEDQQHLLDYVQSGGNLVLFETLPVYAEDDKTKINKLGLVSADASTNVPFLDHLASEVQIDLDGNKTLVRDPLLYYRCETPGEPIYGERVDTEAILDTDFEENRALRQFIFGKKYKVGYHEKRGKGSITVLTVKPTPALMRSVLQYLGSTIPIYSHNPEIKASLFKNDAVYYAVLLNTSNEAVTTPMDISIDGLEISNYSIKNLREKDGIELDASQFGNGRIYLRLPRKNGTVLEIRKK